MKSPSNKFQIHATNINGLGAINVSNEIIKSILKQYEENVSRVYINENIKTNIDKSKTIVYKRILPKMISRFLELCFSKWMFKNIPTLVLGDLPLNGIENQTLFVHQYNLVKPQINEYASSQFLFKVQRVLFQYNLKYVNQIIVQSDFMKTDLAKSYQEFKGEIHVIPLPPIGIKDMEIKNSLKNNNKLIFIYPALRYPHKNHTFLQKLDVNLKGEEAPFEIWLTLPKRDFKEFERLPFVKNIGVIKHSEMIEYYKKVDALVNFSNTESFCLPLIESIFLKKPILTVNQPYSRWMCEDYSYYFNPDDVSSFINSFNRLKNDILNDTFRDNEYPKRKFVKDWGTVANNFNKIMN